MRIVGVIPARWASSRFPGKPLAIIAGKPLLQWVIEQSQKAARLSELVVATDDERIQEVGEKLCRVVMTSPDHPSGSDRVAEAARKIDCDGVVNIQGDEPLIDPEVIDAVAIGLENAPMTTAATPLTDADEFENPNVVKVVTDIHGRALYFSRRCIPFLRDMAKAAAAEQMAAFPFLKHLGIYGYRREALNELVRAPVSPLERAERLEQLRALELGIPIFVARVEHRSIGVDTPEDVARAEERLRSLL